MDTRRAAEVATLRADLRGTQDDVSRLTDLASEARTALGRLTEAALSRERTLTALAGRARRLDILPMNGALAIIDESGIGWRGGPGTADSTVLGIDDRRLTAPAPADLVNRLAHEVTTAYRLRDSRTRSAALTTPVDDQLGRAERHVGEERTLQVRFTRRCGQHKAGSVAVVDATLGEWAVSHGYGVDEQRRIAAAAEQRARDKQRDEGGDERSKQQRA